jgi:hypothetical protein
MVKMLLRVRRGPYPSMPRPSWFSAAVVLALSLGPRAAAQNVGLDRISVGPVAVHDHIAFDLHIPIQNDPYPHEVKEGYAFDGVDLGATLHWHWGRSRFTTRFRVTPASRLHWAYDQDTDFKPATAFTHGDAGYARGRTFAIAQSFPEWRAPAGRGALRYRLSFVRQATSYHSVTTYDLNTNPALPSTSYQRVIGERAIVYELRSTVAWLGTRQAGPWQLHGELGFTPLASILLHNYIPVVLAATSSEAYGASTTLSAGRDWDGWRIAVRGTAGIYQGYRWIEGFSRQEFTFGLSVSPPRFW